MKKGKIDKFVYYFFNYFLKSIVLVASRSSENIKKGIDRESVIVLVIAFYIPLIFLTLSPSVTFKGIDFGVLTTFA